MKKIKMIALCLGLSTATFAQTNVMPNSGPVYFGIQSGNFVSGFNFQLHGVEPLCPPAQGGPKVICPITTRFGITNTTTGLTETDGMLFTLSNTFFSMINQENGDIRIGTNGLNLNFNGSSKRLWLGATNLNVTDLRYAYYNILPPKDNGLFIKTRAGYYGLSLQSGAATDNAIQVMGTDGQTRNFSVQANGFVFARKYTTTLSNIPDYVFKPDYKLMSFADLRQYINTNQHLPNVPSAADYEENGVDLGEMNRVLLEKTEELTLYILQLEERLNKLEEQNK